MSADGTEYDLMQKVVDRLIDKIAAYNSHNCFVCDDVVPLIFPQSDHICTVCIGDSQFDADMFSAGGPEQLVEDTTIIVTPMIRCLYDSPPKSREALLGANNGLVRIWKPRVLRALVRRDDAECQPMAPWIPLVGGEHILRDAFPPVFCSKPTYLADPQNEHIGFIGCTFHFAAKFDWDWN
jgi:hypothetical protein